MSSPVNDDRDKRAMYVPPWARDELRDEETRRIHAEIVAAAERLKPAAPPPASPKPQRPAPPREADFPMRAERPSKASMAASNPADGPFDVESAMRDAWEPSGLDPAGMAPPPQSKMNWSLVSRLAGAGGFAAIVALFVIGAIPMPSIDISLSRDHKDANAAAPSGSSATGNTRQLAAAPPPAAQKPAAPPPAPVIAPQPQPQATAALQPSAGIAPSPASPFPAPVVRPSAVEPPAPPAPKPQGGLPEARVLDYMSREEIDGLVKRGQDLLAIGDISGGRLLLTRAAEAGDARASFALAGTYDAAVVATLGAVGAFPDPVKARAWYQKAAEQGSTEAARRLEQPHLRQR
jgi:hypothetical protein